MTCPHYNVGLRHLGIGLRVGRWYRWSSSEKEKGDSIYDKESLFLGDIAKKFADKERIQELFDEHGWRFEKYKVFEQEIDVETTNTRTAAKEIDTQEVRSLYFDKNKSMKAIAAHFGFRTKNPIRRIFKINGWEARPSSHPKIELDSEEIHRLYFDERLSSYEIAKKLGISRSPINRLFKVNGWQFRSDIKDVPLQDAHRLYYEEGKSMNEIANHFGFKSSFSIRQAFKNQDWEVRSLKQEIDREEVYNLYFDENLSMQKIADLIGCSIAPIRRIFIEEMWTSRPHSVPQKEIDSEEVYRLYFDKELTLQEVADHLGLKNGNSLRRIFRQEGWETRPKGKGINREEVYSLFFDEKWTMEEISEQLDCSPRTIGRIFKEEGWDPKRELDPDVVFRLYYDEKMSLNEIGQYFGFKTHHPIRRVLRKMGWEPREFDGLSIDELRESIFGTSCNICDFEKELIHKKDGKPHHRSLLWTKENLESLNPDEWVALCQSCHKAVHTLMKKTNLEWDAISKILKQIIKDDSD
ncbi:MAG: hypothetical protein P1Q69_00980 [Candidatus Thorarchaeota archaeon]|nr:hypothetical protein [Candidatus Thorarchaeota archaeon]